MTEAETGVTGAPSRSTVPTVSPATTEPRAIQEEPTKVAAVPTKKVQGTINAGKRTYHVSSKEADDRYTLDSHKAYLDSMASHHSFYMSEYLKDVYQSKTTMSTSCNAGQTETNTRGWYGDFEVWLNE